MHVVPFVHGAFDSVFIKDNAVLVARDGTLRALLAHPCHTERRAEQGARRAVLEETGFRITPEPVAPLEGGDVVLRPRSAGAFLGYGMRSSKHAAAPLERFLDAPVVPLELCDPCLYHLDMALTALPDGTLLVCNEALTKSSLALVEASARGPVVRVAREDALGFGLNVVPVGEDVITAGRAPAVDALLVALGYRVHAVHLSEFHHAGGSAACLVACVYEDGRVATSTTTAMRSTAA